MYAFTYHRPKSLREAASLLAKNEEAKYLAGGHSLLPVMKQRLAAPPALIDLAGIPGMSGIERSPRSVTIGAMTRHVEVETSPDVKEAIPALAELVSVLGDPAVRNRGTLGGSLAGNDPSTDWPAAALGLGAIVSTNKRKIHADEFFKGLFETALEEGEIITKVSFPIPQKAGYKKFRHPASRYALVGVFVAKRAGEIRVAVTGAGANGVFRWKAAEEALKTRFAAKSLEGLSHPAESLNSDIHADAKYRAHLIGVMARRAVQAATSR
jgi:aerobic carbon-monoxide dehydrogenase medium subunit